MKYYIADLHLGRYGLIPEVVFPLGSRHIYHHFQKNEKVSRFESGEPVKLVKHTQNHAWIAPSCRIDMTGFKVFKDARMQCQAGAEKERTPSTLH